MQFSKLSILLAFVSSAVAAPSTAKAAPQKRGVLTFQTYNQFQVSDGVGGDALDLVNKAFPIPADPAQVAPEDIDILAKARQTSEDAEQEFLNQLAAAGGRFPDGSPLSVGMTKNKVLKLRTFEMLLQAQLAQGRRNQADGQTKLADVQTKLKKNVADDTANAGKPSQSVKFDGPTPPGSTGNATRRALE